MDESNLINDFVKTFSNPNPKIFTITQSLDQVKRSYASNNKLRLSFSSPARRGIRNRANVIKRQQERHQKRKGIIKKEVRVLDEMYLI